jgi:DNA-binding CsgD family transcriptional regulator
LSDALWGKYLQAVGVESPRAEDLFRDFEARSPPNLERSVRSMNARILLAAIDGRLGETVEDAAPMLELLKTSDDPILCTAFLNGYSTALSILGRYHDALTAAEDEMAIADQYELEFVRRHATLNRARALIGLRRIAQADRCLVSLDGVTDEQDVFLASNCLMERARLQITVGDLEKALAHLFFDPNRKMSAAGRGEYLALRSLALAGLGRLDEARLVAATATAASSYIQGRTLAAVAAALADSGNAEGAWPTTVSRVFEEVTSAGGLDAVVLGCRVCSAFATELAANPEHRGALAALLARSNDIALARRVGLTIPRAAQRRSSLSPREREVHELIAQGRTNREIASALYISESTAKLHVRHIFEKLRVRSRVEAVRAWQSPEDDEDA